VTKLKGERILRTRESEAYVVCEGINGLNHAPMTIYLASELQAAYAFVHRELAGGHWEMLHYPNAMVIVQSPSSTVPGLNGRQNDRNKNTPFSGVFFA
jgi:hypothetical protein